MTTSHEFELSDACILYIHIMSVIDRFTLYSVFLVVSRIVKINDVALEMRVWLLVAVHQSHSSSNITIMCNHIIYVMMTTFDCN
jgi:hypothetical protein